MNRRSENVAQNRVRAVVHAPDMSGANLEGASLARANLAGAILRGTNLRGSDLQGANLRKASLCQADLNGADLGGSNLGMADLRYACLEQANLCRVNLNRANLLGARLAGARLDNVDLAGAILPDGTSYQDGTSLERFTDTQNPAFAATLEMIETVEDGYATATRRVNATRDRKTSWAQFVERTYGSLADDPIEWHPPVPIESEDWEAE